MKKQSLEQAITTMKSQIANDNIMAGNLYSAEQVLMILESLEVAPALPEDWDEVVADSISHHIENQIDELVDYDDCEFEIEYNNTLVLRSVSYSNRGINNVVEEIMSDVRYRLLASREDEEEVEDKVEIIEMTGEIINNQNENNENC